MLTTKDICEMTGLPLTTLTEWVSKGIFKPTEPGGKGRGNSHKFGLMQSVGLMVAAHIHQSERGCIASFVGLVVAAFTNVDERWLVKQFGEGKTHFVMPHQGKPLLQGEELGSVYQWPDVVRIYAQVKKAMAGHSKELGKAVGGNRTLSEARKEARSNAPH